MSIILENNNPITFIEINKSINLEELQLNNITDTSCYIENGNIQIIKKTQKDTILTSLNEYYKNEENLYKMLNIIMGKSKISLRIIDWFVTNYAKKNGIYYLVKNRRFYVYNSYKLILLSYKKLRFDPFCRWERITYPLPDKRLFNTTIGQLNFFKWAIENNIIDYIQEYYTEIEADMNSRNSSSRQNKPRSNDNTKTRKKREELSISATKNIKKEDVEIIVSFH